MKIRIITTTLITAIMATQLLGQNNAAFYSLDTSLLLSADTTTYLYHNTKLQDPYRFLEDLENTENQQWYETENKFSLNLLSKLPKQRLIEDLDEYFQADSLRASLPKQARNGLFYVQSNKRKKTESLIYQPDIDSAKTVLFSTKDMDKEHQVYHTIDYIEPSLSGELVILGISAQGSEQSTIYIFDTKNKTLLEDQIPRAMYGNPAWLPDESGFFYNQFQPQQSPSSGVDFKQSQVWLHYIGQAENQLVFSYDHNSELPLKEIDFPFAELIPNSDLLYIYVYRGTSRYLSLYSTSLTDFLSNPSDVIWTHWIDEGDQVSDFAANEHSLFLLTSHESPLRKVVELDVTKSDITLSNATVVIPEQARLIEGIHLSSKNLYVNYQTEGGNQIATMSLKERAVSTIKLPKRGKVDFPKSRSSSNDTVFFKLESWNLPEQIILHTNSKKSAAITDLQQLSYPGIDSIDFKVLEVPSYDGTMIPMTLIYNKHKLEKEGGLPTILSVYGAYGYTSPPRVSDHFYSWVRKYGIVAVGHVRGGGYRGDAWHKAGYKINKANSWLDAIACAEYLIKEGYTTSEQLALLGSSAGGIAAGRAMTERPDLFSAVHLMVPIVNPLRFENSSNQVNVQEFGTSKNLDEFEALLKMDPYMNLVPTKKYPPTLFSAGAYDARVPMWQPGKMVARMQEYLGDEVPVLFRINYEGGHFGSDLKERKAEIADVLSFFLWQTGHPDFQPTNQPDAKKDTTVSSGQE